MWFKPEFRDMEEFELTLNYKNREISFPVRLMNYGRSYKLEVEIDGTKVMFEPDEERNWRAMISYEDLQANKTIDRGLLELVANELSALLK